MRTDPCLHGRVLTKLLTVFLCVVTPACGGGSPAAPSTPVTTPTPPPTVGYVIHSAETGESVSSTVTVLGAKEGPQTGGSVAFSGVALNAEVSATTPSGFLSPRQGVVDAFGSHDVYLWPDNESVPGRLTQELLYTRDGQGDLRLARITDQVAYAVLDPPLRSDRNRAALQEYALIMSGANGWTHLVETTDPPAGAVVISVQVDLSLRDTAAGTAATTRRADGSISGSTIKLAEEDYLRWPAIILHELGHAFGLSHLVSFRGMMDPYNFTLDDFKEPEKTVLRMMQYRKPGNRWPDDARPAAGSLAAREQLVCQRPLPRGARLLR